MERCSFRRLEAQSRRYCIPAGSMFYDCNVQSSERRSSWNRPIFVDDTLLTGNEQFAKDEELMHSNCDMRQTQTITNGSQIKFGGVQIGRDPDGTLGISRQAYIEKLSKIGENMHEDIAPVRTARRKVSWIAT
jgi:hypothetical protein